jgi:hypothetical protein
MEKNKKNFLIIGKKKGGIKARFGFGLFFFYKLSNVISAAAARGGGGGGWCFVFHS